MLVQASGGTHISSLSAWLVFSAVKISTTGQMGTDPTLSTASILMLVKGFPNETDVPVRCSQDWFRYILTLHPHCHVKGDHS